MEDQHYTPNLFLQVTENRLHLFTTVLQAGIEIKTVQGNSIGNFLCELKGFTPQYISKKIETIFLDGTPVDDLNQQLSGDSAVLALSAAMPGLAGAIFRKNSFHSALRSTTEGSRAATDAPVGEHGSLTVTLKLFNTVAKECGPTLFASGVTLSCSKFKQFLAKRANLLDYITMMQRDNNPLDCNQLLGSLENCNKLFITIQSSNG